jgi:DNA-binding MarR family transcriptional regulator/N-acetylglutamate synthase-like GNAT family acetyltransferase
MVAQVKYLLYPLQACARPWPPPLARERNMPQPADPSPTAEIRRFNRFYTRKIGLLQKSLLQGPFSLTQARVLYELAQRSGVTAAEIGRDLELDRGYLSRLLGGFERQELVARSPSPADGRRALLSLTSKGRRAFQRLDREANRQAEALLGALRREERHRLVAAMGAIRNLLGRPAGAGPVALEIAGPGDLGWVLERHGVLYAREYGWDHRFEALVAEIIARFLQQADPRSERCWIARRDGVRLGSVMCCRESAEVARLRLLLVEPEARGLGLGTTLAECCIGFARQAGYRRLVLWTNDVLHAARRIYERAGFQLTEEAPHRHFGGGLRGQTWQLTL